MTTTRSTEPAETSLTRDVLYAARYYLGGRRGLLILSGLALVAGLALNWSWLVAAGIAPILIGALPCVAMCALGLCMNRAGGKSCATGAGDRESGPTATDAAPGMQSAALEASPGTPAHHPAPSDAAIPVGVEIESQPAKERSTTDA